MGTSFVTARMSTARKERVDRRLAAQGLSASKLVQRLYGYIDATGRIPAELLVDIDDAKAEARHGLIERFKDNRLPIALTDEDVARMLAEARGERFA